MVFKDKMKFEDITHSLNGNNIPIANYQHGSYKNKNLFSKRMDYIIVTQEYEVSFFMSQELRSITGGETRQGLSISGPRKFDSPFEAMKYYNNIKYE